MSPAERLLWWALKERPGGYRFRKQCPQGAFSIDFACLEVRLGIEVDGDAHDSAAAQERDGRRIVIWKGLGLRCFEFRRARCFPIWRVLFAES
jgi:very-short-patch-repair endonuclease